MKRINGQENSHLTDPNLDRMPTELRNRLKDVYQTSETKDSTLQINKLHVGDARELLKRITANSIALSVWSPPYFVGKEYEIELSFNQWKQLLKEVITLHFPIIKPGGFLAINIADILVFKDLSMPRIQAEVISQRKISITREIILQTMEEHPGINRYQLAELLGCSEQTIDRRLNGNNIRGGKYGTQTRIKVVGGLVEEWAIKAGFYPYDRRIWVKDPAWENSRWASGSYRAIDEFEYIYIFWKPGVTKVDRSRLTREEWRDWGSRGVWQFPSVRMNDDHEAKFPIELPRRVIKLLSDPHDIVLDCFMGSGTTALAALEEERRFIGIELFEKYVRLAEKNIDLYLGKNAD